LRAGSNDIYCIGYYRQGDLAFLRSMAPRWTAFDNSFAAIMAETYPNRIYQHAAQTDRITNGKAALCTLPTVWDRLAAAGLDGRCYYSDLPFLALWGAKYLPIGRPFASFLTDCAAGTLPMWRSSIRASRMRTPAPLGMIAHTPTSATGGIPRSDLPRGDHRTKVG
jgi:phospholipase C